MLTLKYLRDNWQLLAALTGGIFWTGSFVTASQVRSEVAVLEERIDRLTAISERLTGIEEHHSAELSAVLTWIDQHEKIHELERSGAARGNKKP